MPIQIQRTTELTEPRLIACIYGQGGVGKSTLAATAPYPIFIDAEQGTKAFAARGIDVAVAMVRSWAQVVETFMLIKNDKTYETIVIDPVDRFLDLLIDEVRNGGDMNLKKYGEVKERMRKFIWAAKESGKHVVFVAHETKDKDDDQQIRSPMLHVNLAKELVNLCDVVGHLRVDNEGIRALRVQPEPKYEAKDRFDALGQLIKNPNIADIIAHIHAKYTKHTAPTGA